MTYPSTEPEVMYDLAKNRLDRQLGGADALDAKLGISFSVGSGLLAIAAGVFALDPSKTLVPLLLTALVYVALTYVCLVGLHLQNWKTGPQIEQVYQDHINFTAPVVKWRAAETLVNHYASNKAKYDIKVTWATWAPRLLLLQTAVLLLGFASAGLVSHHP